MIGKTVSHYRILEKLGEGGMGVVYKARDTHLNRSVALKVLPPEKVADPERKRRFVQEAQSASALNHPNIIHIYDIDQQDGVDYIAMEHVQGKTLGQLIGRKGLSLKETLHYGIQAADALAKAHAAGIVHRDLKPSNIMVTEDGLVKILDFGLAKLAEAGLPGEDEPTRTLKPTTEEGKIVGTAAYMSPEQAEGKRLDPRSDIFSFGSVLYEMVTGRPAFRGDSKISTLAAVIDREPEPLSGVVPRDLEKVVTRCLRKELDRRFQHMADVRVALAELKEESDSGKLVEVPAAVPVPAPKPPVWKSRWAWAAATACGVAIIAAGIRLNVSTRPPPAVPLRAVPLTDYPGSELWPSLSPDGSLVAFSWDGEKQDNVDIYVKPVGGGTPIRLTTDPATDFSPAWSPDGSSIAFLRAGKERDELLLIPPLGGPEQKLAEVGSLTPWLGANSYLAWSPDGKHLVFVDEGSLFALSLATRERRKLTSPPIGSWGDSAPAVSPDGRELAFIRTASWATSDLRLLPLSEDLRPAGEPRRVRCAHVAVNQPTWTRDGREVVFSAGAIGRRGLWRVAVSGSGELKPLGLPGDMALAPQISQDGRRLVYVAQSFVQNLWRMQIPRRPNAPPHRLIPSTSLEDDPQYSPDGKRIAFHSFGSGDMEIWTCDADGSHAVRLTSLQAISGTPRWFPDGRRIVFGSNKEGNDDLWVIDAGGGAPRRLTFHPAEENFPSVSRDGKRIYFTSSRTGRSEVWRMSSGGGEEVQVTRQGGGCPFESADGKRLYYLGPEGLWTVPVEGGEETKVLDSVLARAFAIREDGIYFITSGAHGGPSLQFFRFANQTSTEIARIERELGFGLTVSPDGRSAVYSQREHLSADLMLVENFQ